MTKRTSTKTKQRSSPHSIRQAEKLLGEYGNLSSAMRALNKINIDQNTDDPPYEVWRGHTKILARF